MSDFYDRIKANYMPSEKLAVSEDIQQMTPKNTAPSPENTSGEDFAKYKAMSQASSGDIGGSLMSVGVATGQPEMIAAGAVMGTLSEASKKKQAYKQALLDADYRQQQDINRGLASQGNVQIGNFS